MRTDAGRTRRAPRRCVVAALCAVTLGGDAAAQTVSGIGARDCSALTFALEKESPAAIDAYVAWSQGFISAFNWANPRGHDIRIDAAAILNALGRYCAANPAQPVHAAVRELIARTAR